MNCLIKHKVTGFYLSFIKGDNFTFHRCKKGAQVFNHGIVFELLSEFCQDFNLKPNSFSIEYIKENKK